MHTYSLGTGKVPAGGTIVQGHWCFRGKLKARLGFSRPNLKTATINKQANQTIPLYLVSAKLQSLCLYAASRSPDRICSKSYSTTSVLLLENWYIHRHRCKSILIILRGELNTIKCVKSFAVFECKRICFPYGRKSTCYTAAEGSTGWGSSD